jgi:GTP-binding protein
VVFISAKTGFAVDRVLRMARQLWEISGRTIPTPKINQLFEQLLRKRQPKMVKFKRLKIYYSVQTGNRPFTFKVFCNRATKLEEGYRRYLEGGFIKALHLQGCPIRFNLKGKPVRYAGKP